MKTVKSIVTHQLCTGCGTCSSICPNKAILMLKDAATSRFVPRIVESNCTNCSLCLDVCPGLSFDIIEQSKGLKGENVLVNDQIGRYLNCYIGCSNDRSIRFQCSTGGIVTSLLSFIIKERLVDQVVVTKMNKSNPLEPEIVILSKEVDVLSSSGSKYITAPVNIALREILTKPGRYAVVGLPCHIAGLRKAEHANPVLRERIKLHIGLFCGGCMSPQGTEFILEKLGVSKDDVAEVSYRGNGWPGSMNIRTHSGKQYVLPYPDYMKALGFIFTPYRCNLCYDGANELADISVGDAWLSWVQDKIGSSIVIVRTPDGLEVIRQAIGKNIITLLPIKSEEVVRSQSKMLYSKKVSIHARCSIAKLTGRSIPKTKDLTMPYSLNIRSYAFSSIQFLSSYLLSKRANWFVLKRLLRLINWCPHLIETSVDKTSGNSIEGVTS